MSVRFVWDQKYSVGNTDIDDQHKHLFELANSLPEDITLPEIQKIIMEFYKHIKNHFAAEEELMRDSSYPSAALHRELHEQLIVKLNIVSASVFSDNQSIFAFKKFVYDWITEHIMLRDMDFFRFVRER